MVLKVNDCLHSLPYVPFLEIIEPTSVNKVTCVESDYTFLLDGAHMANC